MVRFLFLLVLLAGGALAQAQPAEAKLDKTPADLRMAAGEARCGGYLVFHDGKANGSNVDKISYFYIRDGAPRYAMPALSAVEVIVNDQPAPTVQQFTGDKGVVRVVLRLSQADFDNAPCLKRPEKK